MRTMLDRLISNFTLFDLFLLVIIYILVTIMSVFLRRNKEFITPVIFVLMFSNYISIYSALGIGKFT